MRQEEPPPSLYLVGIVRDFAETNPDFTTEPSEGYGQYVGIVETELGTDGHPVYDGDIHRVINGATSVVVTPIAPSMANFTQGLTNFTIIDWVLVIDLGGVHGQLQQRIDLNRLCLTDGEEFTMTLFYAQRNPTESSFRFETNLILSQGERPFGITASYD